MARFLDSADDIKKSVSKASSSGKTTKKKKKKNLTTQERINQKSYGTTKPKVKTVTNRTANTVQRRTSSSGGSSNNTTQRYNNNPSGTVQRRNTQPTATSRNPRMQDTASSNNNSDIRQRMAASKQRREQAQADSERRRKESEERRNKVATSANPRMLDTARGTKIESENERAKRLEEARKQKNGDNSMASKSAQKAANRAVKNTPGVVKESAKQVAIGHGKTLADVTEMNQSAAIGSKIDIKSKEFQEDIEKRRKKSTEVSRTAFKELSKMQDKSEAKMQKMTKGAKGLEKAYYGALESGTGMVSDQLLGPAWAASMLSRTYGNTRGKAMKEGATEDEDRAYSLWQGAKEVATEYLFRGIGLSSKLSGAKSLAPSEKLANALTRNMRGPAADVTHAGIRLLGGTAEENAEEGIGWGLDPIISEFTYKKNVRTRQAQQLLREQSDQLRSNIRSDQDARAMASYLSSDDFIDSQIKTFRDNGVGEEEARELAESMRDYLDASLSGDTERMADIEETMSKRLAGKSLKDVMKDELSLSELMDTFASTTLLTATTGLPGTISTTARGAAVREQLGTDGIRALADMAIDFEDDDMSLKAEAMRDRMDSGKDITSTQAYDLMQGVQEQYEKDSDRQQASLDTAQKTIRNNKMVAPYEVERDGSISMDEVTAKNYRSTQKEASKAIRTFVDNSEGQESLTDTQIDRGSRAIAGFQTGVFTVDDANELNYRNTAVRSAFEAETGIDLSEYVVTKDGNVDIPATNTATKNALFAMAADNLVKSAEAETANWIDNTKGEVVTQISRRMGGQGTLALQQALDDVDERDRSDYMMTANATDMLYQAARNMGTEWETVKSYATRMFPNIPEAKLKTMYDAGLADRDMATDTARGQQIELGEKIELKKDNDAPMGQVLVETEAPVKGTVIRTFSELASNLGVDIHLVDNLETGAGNQANGQYIKGNIYINVNSDFESNMGYIFMHEVTHHLRVFAPEQYQALENLVRDKWFNYDASQMQSEIAKKIDLYARNNQTLTEDEALEEIIADAAHEFINDPNFAKQAADTDETLAKAILNSIRNALRMLRRVLSTGSIEDETHMNSLFSQLGILDDAERIWLEAYTQAVKNRAAVEVDRLQNQIYEEGRQSVSDEQTDGYTIKDGNARWTDERIGSLIREYGASNPDYSQAYAVLMNPRDFLKLTLRDKFLDMWNEGANQEEHPEVYSLNEEELRDERQTPFLSIHSNKGSTHVVARVDGHEGRHRMRALMEAGVTSVPVVIQDMDTKYSKKSESWMLLGSQNFGDGPINDKATVDLSDLVPIKESNRDELIQKFGGDAQVRFSISEPVERVKDLIAVHNLKADDIRNTFELGGFPMPSIAVTKDSMGHDMYGDITLMFHSDTIDPQKRRGNEVFGGDAYTPVFPRIHYKANAKVAEKLSNLYYKWAREFGYDKWVDDLFTGVEEKRGLRNDKDMFTPSGNLRKWESLYEPVTLEGVVRVMSRELSAGANGLFGTNPKGASQKQYRSLDEIRADEDRLQMLPEEEYKKLDEESLDKFTAVCSSIFEHNADKFRNTFGGTLDIGEAIAETLNKTRTKDGIRKALTKEFGWEVTDAEMNDLMDAIDAIANLPTGYFEAKPRRAVGFDEVKAAIIPASTDEDIKQGFSDRGIQMYEYDPDVEGDRTVKVNQAASENDLRFSISEDLDEPYMQAVNSGNMKEAQRLVDEAAKSAEYDISVFHGTTGIFDVFDRDRGGGSNGMSRLGFWFTETQEGAQAWAENSWWGDNNKPHTIGAYIKLKNPKIYETTKADETTDKRLVDLRERRRTLEAENQKLLDKYGRFGTVFDYTMKMQFNNAILRRSNGVVDRDRFDSEEGYQAVSKDIKAFRDTRDRIDAIQEEILKIEHADAYEQLKIDYYHAAGMKTEDALVGGLGMAIPNEREAVEKFREQLKAEGYDGIIIRNTRFDSSIFGGINTQYVVFEPEQIKSADTVTYAEDGSVIPLSERFDPTNNDIRYSMSTEDADGNVLTTNQMEYFKNSQARDENGRLVPVYHTTNRGGFTIFDPEYSENHRSLFFASNWDVSQTYGNNADNPIDVDNAGFKTWESFAKFAEENFADYPGWDAEKSLEENLKIELTPNKDNAPNITFEKWASLSAKNKNYHVEAKIPTSTGSEYYLFADSREGLLRDISSVLGKEFNQKGYYSCYLNLENPLIVDARGSRWNNIPYGSDEGLTIDEAISQIEENQAADYGITGIDVYFDYDDEGFPTAVHTRIGYIGVPDEMSWGWDRYEEEDSWTPTIEKDAIDAASVEEQMWEWAEKKLNELAYFDEGEFVNDLETNHIDNNGEIHYTPDNAFGIDFISFGKRADVSTYENMLSDKAANGERRYKTRELAEIAETEGYDGVIIYNCMDLGGDIKHGADPYSTIYIAFSSNQVKDTRNENPTENPDIRYSVSEDEGKSNKDYKHAMSDDYELLEAYEEMMLDEDLNASFADLSDEAYYSEYFGKMLEKYGKADKKARKTGRAVKVKYDNTADMLDAFYSALNEEVAMTYDDEILEEGRKTMAKSKRDFFSSVSQKWNDRWISGGEVLDVDSVKTDIKNLVTGIMANSDTDKQYKIDLAKRTQIDMRNAYQFLKQGREDIASALLYHSALRMIQNVEFVRDDTDYQEYQGIRDYLRGEPIYMSEDYWQDEKFLEFRKAHYGTLKLRKGKTNVDTVYGQLADLFPGVFSEAERERLDFKDDKSGMLQHIGYVTELNLEPFMAAYSSEECADWAFEIADDLYEIMVNGSAVESIADEYKARNEKALEKERARTEKAVRTAKAYKEKYDAQAKAMKTRHAEALLRIRKARDEGIKAEKQKFKEYKETQKEKRLHSKYFDSIAATHKTLRERLLTNTKDKHIPEVYKAQLAELLASFDLQTVASKKVEARRGRPGQKTIKMSALRTTLKNMAAKSELFYLNDTITDIMDELLGIKQGDAYSRSIDGLTLDELNASELKKIDRMLKTLLHEFNNYESVRVGTKRQQAADIGAAQIDACLEHAEKYGNGKDYQTPFLAGINRVLNLDEVTPAYMFRQIDPKNQGIGLMFKELRRSFGKYVRNQNQINDWMEEILGEYQNHGKFANKYGADQIEQWRSVNNSKEFKLDSGQHIKLTPAQMMSILCLSNRQQAYDHMTGAGIVIRPVSFEAKLRSDIKDKANYATPYMLTDTDIAMIKSQLTPDQVKVATKLQQLMATRMAEWGNEASMSVMGIRLFEDPDYFPIKSDKAALEKDFSADQFAEAIRNFGFTKAVQPGASNAIMVDDIFEVVAEHCNQMNLYNAYSESMNDFMRVYNYHKREDTETGYSDYSVEQAIAKAYSQKATTFIGTFIKDLNGNVSKDRTTGIDTLLNASLSNAKKASVFANGRVALQQPTALARAFYVIDPKYLKGFTMSKDTMKEMFEHSPIALWKSWGYYDINMGKSIEDLMMNNGSWLDDMMSDLYGQLDNRTWTAIWGMCKAEIEDFHPDVEKGSDEYWEMVSERMDEVVDLTQVVDSPFHRSHAMRSKDFFHKLTTSFMAEPTLTFNMVRDGLIRAHEAWKDGNKAEAGRIASRTILVFSLAGATTAAAAAIWDAVRGKGGDDDDEDKDLFGKMQAFFERWYDNFIENLQDNLFILNNIYYVKDVVSMFQGWDQRNLGFQGWKHLADAVGQLTGRKVNSKLTWYENFFAGVGYLSGLPIKTLISDTKSVFHLFGLQLPEPMQEYKDKLGSIGGGSAKSAKDINSGASPASTAQKSQETSEGEKAKSSAVETHLWTYEHAPFHVEDGSLADRFLNHFGINLTSAEIAAAEQAKAEEERNEKIEDIRKKTEGLSGEAKDKKIWSAVTTYGKKQNNETPLSDMIQNGNYDYVNELRDMYIKAGGNADYFDERIYATSKTALKKTIHADATDSEIETQQRIKDYLLGHGMDEATMSDIVYKSYTAKDLKAAIMLNDADAAVTELRALLQAGLTDEDFYRLWDNRNKGRAQFIRSYREKGKYKDRFKSTGVYNWPIRGQITSNFGHRSSPGGIGSTYHQGMDIAGSMGDPVGAADGGTVVYAGWYGGAGKTVMIEHDDGTVTQYSHLSWWGVKKGDIVGQGQTIGNVGSTGNSTGPHLHFGVKVNGEYVNPASYLNGNAS